MYLSIKLQKHVCIKFIIQVLNLNYIYIIKIFKMLTLLEC